MKRLFFMALITNFCITPFLLSSGQGISVMVASLYYNQQAMMNNNEKQQLLDEPIVYDYHATKMRVKRENSLEKLKKRNSKTYKMH